MAAKITINKVGRRVVIPRPSRQKLGDGPGDALKKEHGILVYQSQATDASIKEIVHREREKRLGDLRR